MESLVGTDARAQTQAPLPLLTANEMRACEERAIREWGIPSIVLQEHAAIGSLALIPWGEPIHVLAGPGNNGGDALALARLAALQGRSVDVWTPGSIRQSPQWRGDAALQAKLWEGLGGGYRQTDNPAKEVLSWHGWVVDGLFGLGTRLPLSASVLAWIDALEITERRFCVLALDLPTGLDPSSGDIAGHAVRADKTACFGHLKRCHGLRPASDMCGAVSLVPIPLNNDPQAALSVLREPRLFKPDWNTHKYDFGHIAIRAGSRGMSGAAVLAATGALRGGAGLVTVFPDADAADAVAFQVPEAIVKPWKGVLPDNADVLLVGPGGVYDVPPWSGPLVLDASALKDGEGQEWMKRPQTIITPHIGEFSRLFGQRIGRGAQERLEAVERLNNNYNTEGPIAVLVLKGAQTLITGGGSRHVYVNPTGHSGLSTGGTGDFLAGLIASRFAREPDNPLSAATQSVWLHGAAADKLGNGPLMAGELGEPLAQILRELYSA
jgi:NAD(P)H-hydrate epimerase